MWLEREKRPRRLLSNSRWRASRGLKIINCLWREDGRKKNEECKWRTTFSFVEQWDDSSKSNNPLFSLCVCRTTKAYEWGVEAMKLASKLKLDQQPCPPSVASHLLHQVDGFLSAADKVSHPTALEDLNTLARKLDNPKLLDQCKVTQPIKNCLRSSSFLSTSKLFCSLELRLDEFIYHCYHSCHTKV